MKKTMAAGEGDVDDDAVAVVKDEAEVTEAA